MFGRKKDGAKISDRIPVFHVRYIGCTETFVATGRGCSYAPVQRLWDNSPAERNMRKVAILISSQGLTLRDHSEKQASASSQQQQQQQQQQQHQHFYKQQQNPSHRNLHHQHQEQQHHQQQQQQQQQQKQKQPARNFSQEFDIGNISFCNVDRAVNERIFSWIYRNDNLRRLDCHAVLCSTTLKAQTMAIVLSRAFQIAYKDWRAHNRDYDPAAIKSSASTASRIISPPSVPEAKIDSRTSPPPPPPPPAAAAATTTANTSSLTSSVTSSVDRKGEDTPSSSPHTPSRFSDDVAVTSSTPPKDVRSSVSVQQSTMPSSCFVSSSIWDPEMENLVESVDSLQADLDLEDDASY